MNSGIAGDIWLGFIGQLRRSPWGMLLLWFGLTLASVALTIGFSFAHATYSNTMDRLPADLDRIYYATGSTTVIPGAGAAAPAAAFRGFTVPDLLALARTEPVAGFFFTIKERPFRIEDPGTGTMREMQGDLILYHGHVPLYQGEAVAALDRAAEASGVAVSHGFAARPGGPALGQKIHLAPGDSREVVALVGPEARADRSSVVLVSADAVPAVTNAAKVGLYLEPGADPERVAATLTALIRRQFPAAAVHLAPGRDEHRRDLREMMTVAGTSAGIALVMALVAFVNAGSFVSLWLFNRARGLALRRTLGAGPGLITLYAMSDLLLVTVTAWLTGIIIVLAAWGWWLRPAQVEAVSLAGTALAALTMVGGTGLAGWYLTRTFARQEPGTVLGRAV